MALIYRLRASLARFIAPTYVVHASLGDDAPVPFGTADPEPDQDCECLRCIGQDLWDADEYREYDRITTPTQVSAGDHWPVSENHLHDDLDDLPF